MTVAWYGYASGGFIPVTPDAWNPQVAFLVFPRITSSPQMHRRATTRFAARSHPISTLSVADQVRELQAAFSLNVRFALEPGGRPLLEVLGDEVIDEAAVRSAVGRVKGVGDAIDSEREA